MDVNMTAQFHLDIPVLMFFLLHALVLVVTKLCKNQKHVMTAIKTSEKTDATKTAKSCNFGNALESQV